jgi:hypothetical protein
LTDCLATSRLPPPPSPPHTHPLTHSCLRQARRALSTQTQQASSSSSSNAVYGAAGLTALTAAYLATTDEAKVFADASNDTIMAKLDGIEKAIAGMQAKASESTLLAAIINAKTASPNMIMARHFDLGYYGSLSDDMKARLLACCKSGAENADSGMGGEFH